MINVVENFDNEEAIWAPDGRLAPLVEKPATEHGADVAAIIVNRDRPDLVEELLQQLAQMGQGLAIDVFIIEMGSDKDNLRGRYTYYYPDEQFRGKCFGHNVGLRIARKTGNYRYYWILMNDIRFDPGVDAIRDLVDTADKYPEIAILSPTERDSQYPASRPVDNREFHLVSTCDYLGFLMRSGAIDKVGFLNPEFKYSWGAIHELSYHLYRNGYRIAYSDMVVMKHLGGTTYGKTRNTISREEYQRNAKLFCANYFVKNYGNDWDMKFSKALPEDISTNTFRLHRKLWESENGSGRKKSIFNRVINRLKRLA